MKTNITTKLLRISLAALLFAPQAFSAPQKKSDYLYELKSTVKGLGVLQDGIMGAGVNLEIEGRKGWNEITVTAPNYATRKIRFLLEAGKKKTLPIELSKLKYETTPNWKSPFKRFDADKLEKKASACAWYQNKAQDKSNCDRVTYLDDIFYAEESLFKMNDLREYLQTQELNNFRSLVAGIGREQTNSGIEDFYTRHPSQPSAYQLASLSALMQGDCPRVYSIFTDAQQVLEHPAMLRIHMAVCAEAHNNSKLRDQIVAEGLKDKEADPGLAYWAFQIQLPAALPAANQLATRCFKTKPQDVRCQDAMAMVAKVQGKPYKMGNINIEDETFKSFLNIEEKLPKGLQESLYLSLASQIENYPLSLENYLLMAWVNTVHSKELVKDAYISRKMEVAAIQAGSTLEKIVEAIEKDDLTLLLPPVYLRRLTFQPDDPNLWYRLIRSFAKAKQCKEMLEAVERGNAYLPKYNSSLLQMRGSCEMELGLNKNALATYQKILEVNPKVWSSPYNLATMYERSGRKKEAYDFFKKTLELNPPADIAESVKLKVIQLQPAPK
jgi:tetratricopeptide (TPR) repeat protein